MPHISEAAPLQIERFYTGLYTYRNPLIVPIRQVGRRMIELYDAISDGLNMECSNRLTLVRRPGYTPVSTTPISGTTLYFYSFKPSDFPGQIYQVIDTTTVVAWYAIGTPAAVYGPLITKPTPALTNFTSVGAYCYIAQETFAQKWDSPGGGQGISKWGIDIYTPSVTQGPSAPTGLGNRVLTANLPNWVITNNTQVFINLPGVQPGQSTTVSNWVDGYAFQFAVEGTPHQFEIVGIQVDLNGITSTGSSIGLKLRLMRAGQFYGSYRTVTLPANTSTVSLGSPGDPWDGAWVGADINAQTFGVSIQAVNSGADAATCTIGNIRMTVYVNATPSIFLSTAGTGSLNPQIGYYYRYTYGNSFSGAISSPSLLAYGSQVGLPILPANQSVTIQVPSSPDQQVTHVHVYRTTDGGGEPFYELPNSPVPNGANATTVSIIDNSPDEDLNIASICPDPHFNDAPPGGALDPVWFAGRLWMHRQNLLFFASGPDITQGNGQEAWYPVYRFALPSGQIIRKFSTPIGMLVVTSDEIFIVQGLSAATFTVNSFLKNTGIRTWTAADSDGTNIYIFTSDRQFLMINANGIVPMASAIADQLESVDPTEAYVTQFRYTHRQNMIFVGDGSTTLWPLNQDLQAWNTRQVPVQGVGAIGSVEILPGVFQFWRGRPSGTNSLISFRDDSSFLDENTPYAAYATFGPIPVADFLTLAQLRDIVLTTAATASQVTLSVLANEVSPVAGSQFQILAVSSSEPPELSATPSISFTANRYSWKSAPLPELINFYFKRIDFSADANPDELWSWTTGGTQTTGGSSLGQPGQLPQIQGR